jgi:hypothetical protein
MSLGLEWNVEETVNYPEVKDKETGKKKRIRVARRTVHMKVTYPGRTGNTVRVYKGYRHRGEVRVKVPSHGVLDKEQSMLWFDFVVFARNHFGGFADQVVGGFTEALNPVGVKAAA